VIKRWRLRLSPWNWLAVGCWIALAGCQDSGPPRYRISGTVTHQGQPVPIGSILFQPDGAKQNSGPYGFAPIREGRYDTQLDGKGFSGGPQIVIVEAFDGVNIDPDYNPYGLSISSGYIQPHDLPHTETTLDIRLPTTRR
jgi:hypothetical protein